MGITVKTREEENNWVRDTGNDTWSLNKEKPSKGGLSELMHIKPKHCTFYSSIGLYLTLFMYTTGLMKLFKLFAYNDDQKRKHFLTRFAAELTHPY